jgi:hypothetical protein
LWIALAYADRDGDCNSDSDAYCYRGAEVYADTAAASHTAASAVRRAFNSRFLRGLVITRESP